VQAPGLEGTLSDPGPFTVFDPTDGAFAKLPAGTVEGLFKDIPKLRQILTFHVVRGKRMASDVVKLASAKTVQGQSVRIATANGVTINGANVITPNSETDNGVIHVSRPHSRQLQGKSRDTTNRSRVCDGRVAVRRAECGPRAGARGRTGSHCGGRRRRERHTRPDCGRRGGHR
jgi:hypothetical protein